jgi:uncharacterized membrane protein
MVTRALRHLLALPGAVARAFPRDELSRVEQAIRESEQRHGGQIRFAVEAALDPLPLWRGLTARERAIEAFAELRVWDTERNNGVLLYLLLADRDVEIVADRGFNGKVAAQEWERVCRRMESALREGRHADAVVAAIESVSQLIASHFPRSAQQRNELPDRPAAL